MNVLNIYSLTKSFGDKKVIGNITLSIEQGEIFALIGPNGAGKTTMINCTADLLDYNEGKITIFNKCLKKEPTYIKKRMGVLFENNSALFVHLKGEEHLQFVGEIYGLGKEEIKIRVEELLDFFELNDHRYKLIEEYSKGMKKKIAFASILLHNPEFVILDEPFDSLDALTVIKVKKLIKSLKEKGKTVLITSHILSYIDDIADEVAIMNKGEIVYQAETKDIRNKIKNEVTKETYQSLEEIFLYLTTEKKIKKKLSPGFRPGFIFL